MKIKLLVYLSIFLSFTQSQVIASTKIKFMNNKTMKDLEVLEQHNTYQVPKDSPLIVKANVLNMVKNFLLKVKRDI